MYEIFYALPISVAVSVLCILFFVWTIVHLLAAGSKIWHWLNAGFVLVWAVIILRVTVLHRSTGIAELRLLPLQPLLLGTYNNPEYFRALLMNLLLFVPLGAGLTSALPTRWPVKRRIGWTILAGFVLSLLIELAQLVFSLGYAEMDDLLSNTLGAALGASQLRLGKYLRMEESTEST